MSDAFLPYGRQEISEADVEALVAAARSPLITQGPRGADFERAFCEYTGAKHAVVFSSGTAALHGAAAAAGLQSGDEALVPPITFAASANCALYVGARPRFVDIDRTTWNLDVGAAGLLAESEQAVKAVVAVSYAGLPVDIEPLRVAGSGVLLIEDASHALGAERNGQRVGGPGGADMTTFSFHPVKAMTTGEGGMVTTEDGEIAERLRRFREHGIDRDPTDPDGPWAYELTELGFNYRITEIQCALGISQLGRVAEWVSRRNAIAERYRDLLSAEEGLELPPTAGDGCRHGYHLFPVWVRGGHERRRAVFEQLRAAEIGVQVHYVPVYRLVLYRERLGYPQTDCPNAEDLYSGLMSLPMFPGMSAADTERVAGAVREALSSAG